jgi:DNA invertase Pin-like site-specific DNA recombinase
MDMSKENSKDSSLDGVLPLRVSKPKPQSYVFTDQQVEAAKLWAQGFSLTQIADRLGVKYAHHFSGSLKEFRRVAECMRKVVEDLEKAHYWEKQIDRKSLAIRASEGHKRLMRDGFWIYRVVPYGYMTVNRRLEPHPEKAQIMNRVYKRVDAGEVPRKVAKDEGLDCTKITRMLRNPVYKGFTPDGQVKLKHKSLIDEATWDRVQRILAIKKPPRALFGFRRTATGVEVDKDKVETMRRVCSLRSEHESTNMIAEKLKISQRAVERVLQKRVYKDIVGADLWEKAHSVHLEFGAPALKKFREKQKDKIKDNILAYLHECGRTGSTTGQMSKTTGFGESTVLRYLSQFKRNGIVDRQQGLHGRWFVISKRSS